MTIQRFPSPDYQIKEAYNTLCANLSFIGKDIKSILVTSCRPSEGKSEVSMELMRAFARLGLRVALVDADIRASALQMRYDIRVGMPEDKEYPGLARYLAGHCEMEDILAATNIRGASMILSGKSVVNSLPLLSSERLDALMARLRKAFDLVIVDSPPVGTIIDAAKIARCCDGVLLVVKSGLIPRRELLSASRQMERAGSQVLGTVLNQYDERKYGDGYYHKDYYSHYDRRSKKATSKKSTAVRKRSAQRP